jgi:hypothetical protein
MPVRLAPRIVSVACLILLCAVLVPALSASGSAASEKPSLAGDRQDQQAKNSSQRRALQADYPNFWVYLPLVTLRFVPGIHGQVTYKGAAAAVVALHLWLCDSSSCSEGFTTTTNAEGVYTFTNVPSLGVDQRYYVRFGPNTTPAGDSRYLSNWSGPDILSYTVGDSVAGGDFDIADVAPLLPCTGAKVFLPARFSWQPRQIAAETYRLLLSNPITGEILWESADLGDVGVYAFDSLPPGLMTGQTYDWQVNVRSAAGGFGSSFARPEITFLPAVQSGIYGRVTYNCAPASGITLNLRLCSGTTCAGASTAITRADGTYVFPSPPSLLSGQKYYVRFGANQDPSGDPSYVSHWYGPDITSYTAETAVPGGSFDIANVQLISPPAETLVPLPAKFEWQRRGLGSEGYQWVLFNPSSAIMIWKTPILADASSYLLLTLPAGFMPGYRYGWYVNVHTSADGYGSSYYYRGVGFSTGVALPVGSPPVPQGSQVHEDPIGMVPSPEK